MAMDFDKFCDMAWLNLSLRPGQRDPRKLRRLDVTHEAWRLLARKGAEFDHLIGDRSDDFAYMDRIFKVSRIEPFIMRLGFWDGDSENSIICLWIVTGGITGVEVVFESLGGDLIPVDEDADDQNLTVVYLCRLWVMTYLHFEQNRPQEFQMRRAAPKGVRQRLNAHRHERVVTVSLTKHETVLIGDALPSLTSLLAQPKGEPTGRKVCEHEVRPFTRRLRDGRLVNVRGHRRGDPSVPRKTVYRVVP